MFLQATQGGLGLAGHMTTQRYLHQPIEKEQQKRGELSSIKSSHIHTTSLMEGMENGSVHKMATKYANQLVLIGIT